METRANLVTVGLFVLAVIAAGFGAAYWLLKGTQTGTRATVIVLFNGPVSGLATGAVVAFNGIKIGEVTRLTFAPDDPTRVIAYLSVDASAPLKTDSKASLGFSGLTGYATVQIAGGSIDSKPLLDVKDGVPRLTADVSSVQDLVEGAKRIMGRADDALTTIQKLVDNNGPSVTKVIQNVESFSDALSKNSGNIDKFMGSIGQTADVLTKVSGRIEKLAEDVDALVVAVDRQKVGKVVDDVAKISGDLAKSTDKIASAIDEARGIVSDARKVMATIDSSKISGAVDDIAKVAKDLSNSSGKIQTIVGDTQGAMQDARKLLAAVDPAKVSKMVDDVAKISGDLASSSGQVDGLVTDVRTAVTQFKTFAGNMDATVADSRKIITAIDPSKVSSVLDQVAKFGTFVTAKTADFDAILTQTRSATANIDKFTSDVAGKTTNVTAIIDDTSKTMQQLEVASRRVDGILAKIDGAVGSDDGKGLFTQGKSFLAEATEAAKAFKELSQAYTGKADEISSAIRGFTSQGMREVKDLVSDSRKTLSTIDRAVSEFDRNPQRVIFGPDRGKVPEYGPNRR